jgi:hypothetical protein
MTTWASFIAAEDATIVPIRSSANIIRAAHRGA